MIRRTLLVGMAAIFLAAGCGDDSGSSTATGSAVEDESGADDEQMLCDALAPLADLSPESTRSPDDVALVEEAAEAAEGDLKAGLERVAEVLDVLSDPEADIEEQADIAPTEAEEAEINTIITDAADECGLSLPLFAPGDTSAATAEYESDDLRAAVEQADPALVDRVRNIGRFNTDVTMQIEDLTDSAEAMTACEAGAAYLDSIGLEDASLRVADTSDTTLAERTAGGDCAPA